MRASLSLAGALALAAQQPAPAPAPAPAAAESAPRPEIAAMQREIAGAMLREGVPVAAVALVDQQGIVWMGGFGQADARDKRDTTPATPFAAAAVSPLLVGLLAARYAALNSAPRKEGEKPRAPLDEPLDDEALGLSNPYGAVHSFTLATLLEQTAGLEDLSPRELLGSVEMTPLLAEVLHLRAHPARWAPGARFSPSRVGLTAAASQLERWTRKPFFAIADAELFKPLGMGASTFHPDLATLAAMPVNHEGRRALPWSEPLAWPALGLVTSVADLASLLRMLLATGVAQSGPAQGQSLVPPALVERVRRGRTLGDVGVDMPGLGARVWMAEGREVIGQQGVFAGGASALGWLPHARVGYAVLLNQASPAALAQISDAALRVLLRNRPAEPPPPGPRAPDELRRAAGVWRLASVRLEALRFFEELFDFALVSARADALEYSPSLSSERPFLPVGHGAFRAKDEVHPSLALVARAADGEEELIAPEGTYLRASAVATFGRLAVSLGAVFALLSSLLFALVWVPRALFGSLRGDPDLRVRSAPALAALVLLELILLLCFSAQPLGTRNLTSLLICALTLIFPALSLAALLECFRPAPGRSTSRAAYLVRAHALAVSLFSCGLSLELVLHGLAGIRTWAL